MKYYDPELLRRNIIDNLADLVKENVRYCEISCYVSSGFGKNMAIGIFVRDKSEEYLPALELGNQPDLVRAVMSLLGKNINKTIAIKYNDISLGIYFDNPRAWWMTKKP